MPVDQRYEPTQRNQGESLRVAGRDYHEHMYVPDSVKLYLASKPDANLDREALGNERLFYYRFGLDLPRAAREQIIALKQKHGFTDRQMRLLRLSGQLRIRRDRAWLVLDRSMAVAGWIQLGVLALFCVAMVFAIAFSAAPSWKQLAGQFIVAIVGLAGAWVLKKLYIEPWRLVRNAEGVGTYLMR